MSPIKDVSDIRRLPRLGKIRLGIKVEPPDKNPYPRATDFFVVPDEIKEYVEDEPKQLQIMFPVDDPGVFAPQFLKCYSLTQGLICLSDDSEILTNRGWAGIDGLNAGDIAVTMDLATGVYTEQPVDRKEAFYHKGDLINFHTRSLDALLTPDHRVIYRQNKRQSWKIKAADKVPSQSSWPAVGPVNKPDMPISDDLLSLLGWIIPEGTQMNSSWARSHNAPATGNNRLTPEERAKRASYLSISQSKHPFVEEIAELLQRLFGRINKTTVKNTGGPSNRGKEVLPRTVFFLGANESAACRYYLGESIHRIPRVILNNGSPHQLQILLNTLLKANGSQDKAHGTRYFAGKNQGQADDIQELCTRMGLRSSINPGSRHPSTVGQFWIQVSPGWKSTHTIKRKPTQIPYNGRVWCITVPNGTFIARRRGRVFTTGNCKGDGIKAVRKIDVDTGDIASHITKEWVFREVPCDSETCPQFTGDPEFGIKPQCRRVMNLLFALPDVPGLGVWQLDTSSFYSIVNINSCLDVIRGLCGRIYGIPLVLALEPMEVTPLGIKKKTIHVLHVRSNLKLADLQRIAGRPAARALIPLAEEEEAPGDLFPEHALAGAETAKRKAPPPEPAEGRTLESITTGDIPDLNTLPRLCYHYWQMQPVDVCGELGYKTMEDLKASGMSPWEAWLTIKQLKQPPEPGEEPPGPEQAGQESEELWPEDIPGAGDTPPAQPAQTTAVAEPIQPGPEPAGETEGFIDMDQLAEQLKTLQAKGLKAWSESNLLSYMKTFYKVEGKTVLEAAAKLDEGAAAHFKKRVQETLEML